MKRKSAHNVIWIHLKIIAQRWHGVIGEMKLKKRLWLWQRRQWENRNWTSVDKRMSNERTKRAVPQHWQSIYDYKHLYIALLIIVLISGRSLCVSERIAKRSLTQFFRVTNSSSFHFFICSFSLIFFIGASSKFSHSFLFRLARRSFSDFRLLFWLGESVDSTSRWAILLTNVSFWKQPTVDKMKQNKKVKKNIRNH